MKKSSKLLIALILACFIVTLMGFMIMSKLYYKTARRPDGVNQSHSDPSFKIPSQGMISTSIQQPYHVVVIADGRNSDIELNLHPDNDSGIKLPESLKDDIRFLVSHDTLRISFRDGFSGGTYHGRITIKAYSPYFKAISVEKTNNFVFTAAGDSLKAHFRDCNNVSPQEISRDTLLKIVNGDTTILRTFNSNGLQKLSVALNNSKLILSPVKLSELNLDLQNHSSAELRGAPADIKIATIYDLHVKSTGENTIKIQDYTIIDAKGSISDETALEAPTPILRKLLKD